ncbi:MAG: rod shape-determining protein MreC [Xanthomonadales bacterium]|nr:rod shape-determining protein MreC [Xanthomonadales bacterium]ODU91696.1 MAG: rod shape-determining protein MreC [Rhodanobacter sp. SCN 66-43]OJY85031.1 MAG: rod shape-determining protein MreC [Xanthomonadales bacterium 66-474]
MALPQKESTPIFSDATAGTLRLIAYLALAAVLMVLDHRNGWLHRARYAGAAAIVPIYKLAAAPADWIHAASTTLTQHSKLVDENRQLREALLLAEARLNRMHAVTQQNERLKQLLDTQQLLGMHAQLARLIDVQLGPTRDRVMLNVGVDEGVHVGQTVIDSHGVMGQIVEVLPHASVAMLVIDPDHAVPVMASRTGLRGIAHGTGDADQLVVPNLPLSSDVKNGDQWVTSGLGGRFPAGFPVGTVTQLKRDASGMFLEALVKPAAQLERSGEVLLLRDQPDPVGPPAPAPEVGPPDSLAPRATQGGRRALNSDLMPSVPSQPATAGTTP